jgi:hypothetical protein
MSKLTDVLRPAVSFDPSNTHHRECYYQFVKTGTWGRCAVRFNVDDMFSDLPSMIERRLVEFYVSQEFSR